MDDTDDKIRRNLVAASTIILLLAWLEMPLATVAERLLNTNVQQLSAPLKVQAFRVWWAAFFLMLYLFLRFWLSDERLNDSRAWAESWRSTVVHKVDRMMRRDLDRFSKTGRDSGRFNPGLLDLARKQSTVLDGAIVELDVIMNSEPARFKRGIKVNVHTSSESGGSLLQRGVATEFEVKRFSQYWLMGFAILKTSILSAVGMRLFWPLGFGVVAIALVLGHLLGFV